MARYGARRTSVRPNSGIQFIFFLAHEQILPYPTLAQRPRPPARAPVAASPRGPQYARTPHSRGAAGSPSVPDSPQPLSARPPLASKAEAPPLR